MPFHRGLRSKDASSRLIKALAISVAFALAPSVAQAATVAQGEDLRLRPVNAGKVVSDASAQGRESLRIFGNATASRSLSVSQRSVRLAVRARGTQCKGAPQLQVHVDGRIRLRANVSRTRYATYTARLSLAPGHHTIKASFRNDHSSTRCDRNLVVDHISLYSVPDLSGARVTDPGTPREPAPYAPTSGGSVVFAGDFESGNLSQWSSVQRIASDRLTTQESDVREGRYSAMSEIRGGDPLLFTGQRSEVLWGSDKHLTLRNGNEYYFGWSTKFANDFPSPTNGGHCLFIQWKTAGTGSPPLDLECKDNRIEITYGAKCGRWNTPLVRGGWNDFVARIKFSPIASEGFIELWHQSPEESRMTKKVTQCNTATLKSAEGGYLKLGYYRRDDETRTGRLFHDGMKVGTSFAAVAPR